MARMVFCRKHQQEMEGLETPPYPGTVGQDIYENISKQAWEEWKKQQTMLINEQHLNMMNADHRKFLQEEMKKFFAGEDHAKAEGYVAIDDKK